MFGYGEGKVAYLRFNDAETTARIRSGEMLGNETMCLVFCGQTYLVQPDSEREHCFYGGGVDVTGPHKESLGVSPQASAQHDSE